MIMKINNHFKDQTKFFRYGTFLNVPDSYIQSPSENNSFTDNQRAGGYHVLHISLEEYGARKIRRMVKRCKVTNKSLVVQVQFYQKGASL